MEETKQEVIKVVSLVEDGVYSSYNKGWIPTVFSLRAQLFKANDVVS